jgi:hypothetical protein
MKITPEMRESVKTEGQPMFMPATDAWSRIHENLTPEEQTSITEKSKKNIIRVFRKLPSAKEGAEVALSGQEQRHWYRDSAEAISNTFGPDADRFAGLLAALSPQVGVETNLENAVRVWDRWQKDGRPESREAIEKIVSESVIQGKAAREKDTSSALGAWINNSIRSLSHPDPQTIKLSGPKVDSFMKNLRNNVHEVTNDRWMGKYGLDDANAMIKGGTRRVPNKVDDLGKSFAFKGATYLALSAHVREVAKTLTLQTGDTWTPAETQAAIWSYVKAKSDGTQLTEIPVFDKLLKKFNRKSLDDITVSDDPF